MSETFRIDIVASSKQAQSEVRSVETQLERLNKTAAGTSTLLNNALKIVGIGSGIVLVQQLVSKLQGLSDTYTEIQNRLSVVTRGTAQLESVTGSLLEVANRSRTGFEATAQLYARTALATRDLGTSQEALLGITETVNKAIILSGASAKEANNGLIQLSQAISSNRLAGDELRSVLEQLPVVADIIAKQLGVTRGELRALGSDGKITADVILKAFQAARGEIEDRFARTVPTVSQAVQVLQNNLIRFVGTANQATGASRVLAQVLQLLGNNLSALLSAAVALPLVFNADRIVKYVQSLFGAARAARELSVAVETGNAVLLGSNAAQAQQAEFAVAAAQARLAQAAAELQAAEAAGLSAVAITESTQATLAQIGASSRAATAEIARARATIALVEAEAGKLEVEGFLLADVNELVAAEARLTALETTRTGAVQRLAAAEAELAASVAANAAAQEGRIAQAAQLTALQAVQAERAAALAAAQGTLNKALAPAPGLLSKVGAFFAANPFGIAAVAVGALSVALIGIPELIGTASSGLSVMLGFVSSLADAARGLAQSLPGVGTGLQAIAKAALIGGAASAAFLVQLTNPVVAATLAVTALVVGLGSLKQAIDKVHEASDSQAELVDVAQIGSRILAARDYIKSAQEAVNAGDQAAIAGVARATADIAKLVAEARKLQGTDRRDKRADADFEDHLRRIRDEIGLLAKSRHERELGLELEREADRFKRANKRDLTGPEREQTLNLLRQRSAARELAEALDQIRGPGEDFRRGMRILDQALDQGRVSVEQYNRAVQRLEQERLDQSPFAQSIGELQRDLNNLRKSTPDLLASAGRTPGTGAAGELDDLRAANRERAVQVELARQLDAARSKGASDTELAAKAPLIAALIRETAETERLLGLQEQLAELRRSLSDDASTALLPEREQAIRREILATRELNEVIDDPAALAAQIRRNAALKELGGILNGLQDPVLAQAQAQSEVNRQITQTNELLAQGAITLEQYSLLMQKLTFRSQEASTSFTDGFSVALRQMTASLTEATIGQTAFTSAINAAGAASAEFVQAGTVDFRKLALNVIAEVSKMITQLLALRAVQALARAFGGGGIPGLDNPTTPGGNFVELRAAGGPVNSNTPYLVGENGPELFTPGRSGAIVPNDQVGEAMARAGSRGDNSPVVNVAAPNVVVHNSFDPAMVIDALDTPAGARVMQNQVSRNPSAFKRVLS